MNLTETSNSGHADADWRILGLVNLSRLLTGSVLLGVFQLIGTQSDWGKIHPRLFFISALSLLVISIVFALVIRSRNFSSKNIALIGCIVDSLLFSLLIHSSGGVGQGIGAILLMSICASALILPRQLTIFAAAVAFIFLLGQHIYAEFEQNHLVGDYTSIGLFGLVLFLSSWTTQLLGERYRLTEELALKRGVDIANLSQLNDYVVQRIREGVLVVDGNGAIRLMNLAAARMLNVSDSKRQHSLREISERLYTQWQKAVANPYANHKLSLSLDGLSRIVPSFIPLGHRQTDGMLVFLEDTSLLQERVQQSKLAALGRLSASIAHEIRNPLAAISHAEQLLSESEHLQTEDRYFTGLIHRHVGRVNEIVENVLSLSRATVAEPEEIDLREWTVNFVIEYMQLTQLGSNQIRYAFPENDITIPFATSQLRQIIENIFDNAIAHSGIEKENLRIMIQVARHQSGRWQMTISDNGQGFADHALEEIFEPFHSGSSQSSGLGLYIARELATLNRANLSAYNNDKNSATFDLVFADLERWKT